jgi:hypothetical protein
MAVFQSLLYMLRTKLSIGREIMVAADRRGVPIREAALGRNEDSGKRARRSISDALAKQVATEPSSGTMKLAELVKHNLASLAPKKGQAEAFISKVALLKQEGRLDEETASAERAPAKIVLALCKSLEDMVRIASQKDDKASLQTLVWASGTLVNLAEGPIFESRRYPKDSVLKAEFIKSRMDTAKNIYDTVVDPLRIAGDSGTSIQNKLEVLLPSYDAALIR